MQLNTKKRANSFLLYNTENFKILASNKSEKYYACLQ